MSLKSELLGSGSGMQSWGHLDHGADSFTFQTVQDVEPILDSNKRRANDGDGYNAERDMQHVASIPLVIVEQWLKEGIDVFNRDHMPAVLRKLNDIDNRYLRTGGGML